MSITVRELLQLPHLQLSLICGAAGIDHQISWVHTSDLPNLRVPPMADLIMAEDLDLLGSKAEQNTSGPSNPRPATAADFRAMFACELQRAPG
jgi:hypothetical protein